eukprot:1031997-Rhodomonas_salina.3
MWAPVARVTTSWATTTTRQRTRKAVGCADAAKSKARHNRSINCRERWLPGCGRPHVRIGHCIANSTGNREGATGLVPSPIRMHRSDAASPLQSRGQRQASHSECAAGRRGCYLPVISVELKYKTDLRGARPNMSDVLGHLAPLNDGKRVIEIVPVFAKGGRDAVLTPSDGSG